MTRKFLVSFVQGIDNAKCEVLLFEKQKLKRLLLLLFPDSNAKIRVAVCSNNSKGEAVFPRSSSSDFIYLVAHLSWTSLSKAVSVGVRGYTYWGGYMYVGKLIVGWERTSLEVLVVLLGVYDDSWLP